jgi:hypothetical protein
VLDLLAMDQMRLEEQLEELAARPMVALGQMDWLLERHCPEALQAAAVVVQEVVAFPVQVERVKSD